MRLLVGLDERDGGKDALALARVLGGEGAKVLVVTSLYTGLLPAELARFSDEEAEEAAPLFEAARERLPGMEVETRAYGGGSAAAILTKLAEAEHFDAIVIGSPHRGPIGQAMIGSVARSLLNGSPTDVAVAPKGYAQEAHTASKKIAVAYDGSPESKLALQHAEALAQRTGAKIEVLTVVVPPALVPVMVPNVYSPQVPPDPERVLSEGVNSVGAGVAAAGTRLDGEAAPALVAACERGTDLLVMGSRGYGPLTRVLLGSVVHDVIERAPCPVLVVRRP